MMNGDMVHLDDGVVLKAIEANFAYFSDSTGGSGHPDFVTNCWKIGDHQYILESRECIFVKNEKTSIENQIMCVIYYKLHTMNKTIEKISVNDPLIRDCQQSNSLLHDKIVHNYPLLLPIADGDPVKYRKERFDSRLPGWKYLNMDDSPEK
jgi:hypothetical protein